MNFSYIGTLRFINTAGKEIYALSLVRARIKSARGGRESRVCNAAQQSSLHCSSSQFIALSECHTRSLSPSLSLSHASTRDDPPRLFRNRSFPVRDALCALDRFLSLSLSPVCMYLTLSLPLSQRAVTHASLCF